MKKLNKLYIGASLFLFSCVTNPITGRKSFQMISNQELAISSLQEYRETLRNSKIIKNTAEATQVKNVGKRIKTAAENYYKSIGREDDLADYNWEFNLIESNQLNAWCMPGGKVAFYSGIIPICKNEAGVAVVMGHEVAHALAGHGNERISSQMLTQGLGIGFNLALGSNVIMKNIFSKVYPIGAQGILLAYSRKQELEADQIGLYIMSMAGYDPHEAIAFWHRMEASSQGGKIPEFLSTHPNPDHRRVDLYNHLPKALEYYYTYNNKN